MFGQGCMESCGHCVALKQCHHVNGSCLNGCDRGYQGIKCKKGCTSPLTHSHTKSSSSKSAIKNALKKVMHVSLQCITLFFYVELHWPFCNSSTVPY